MFISGQYYASPALTFYFLVYILFLISTDYVTEWDDGLDEIKCEFTLAHEALREQMQCVALAWNSTGSVLAVAYARTDYEDWWRHSAAICTVSNEDEEPGPGVRWIL